MLSKEEKVLYNHLHTIDTNEAEIRILDFFRPWHFTHEPENNRLSYRDYSHYYDPVKSQSDVFDDEFIAVMVGFPV